MKKEVVTPILVKRRDAAAMLSMSIDSFERHIEPSIKLVRAGSMFMVPVTELERHVAENATFYGAVHR
jgi:hypothetical protein